MNKQKIMSGLIVSAALLLGGCSGHPSSGDWVPEAGANTEFVKLTVSFEGKAEFFIADKEAALLRCFWAAQSKHQIDMQCSKKAEEQKYYFSLKMDGDNQAALHHNDEFVAKFKKSA